MLITNFLNLIILQYRFQAKKTIRSSGQLKKIFNMEEKKLSKVSILLRYKEKEREEKEEKKEGGREIHPWVMPHLVFQNQSC